MSRFLLDTHILLWCLYAPEKLTPSLKDTLANPDHQLIVSVASTWEMAIKKGRGKLYYPDELPEHLDALVVEILPVGLEHSLKVSELPGHHHDPFDRMLVAQAMVEGLTLVTKDKWMGKYGVAALWG